MPAEAEDNVERLRARLLAALPGRVLIDVDDLTRFARDSSRAEPTGLPAAVVEARSTDDVAATVRIAAESGVPVSIRGAGTGLAGGAVGYAGGIVLSMARMDEVLEVAAEERLIRVEAGVITHRVDEIAGQHALMYAPDPASHRESTIGGNIATDAGGLRCLKYGVTRDHVAGLRVVLADGSVIDTGGRTRKNAVGYDLTGVFVGSEGTLGIITEATLRLLPRPTQATAFRADFRTVADAGQAVARIMAAVDSPESLELLDTATVRAVAAVHPELVDGPGDRVLLLGRCVGANAAADATAIAELCLAAGALDATAADGDALLEARRVSGRSLSAQGLRVSSDVAVPVPRLVEMFAAIAEIAHAAQVEVPTFAHAGDGNLHPSVIVTDDDPGSRAHAEAVLDRISSAALALGGTLSGEHGIGSLKRHSLGLQLDAATLAAHRRLKLAFDPAGTLSPGRAI